MIVGHLGVAAALKRARPGASVWWLLPAAIAPDLLDIALALAGVCNPYGLYSHTVPAALLVGAAMSAAAVLAGRRETAVVVLLLVMLHLPLDYFTGSKLYWPGGEIYGLRLYERPVMDFAIEVSLVVAGWALLRSRPPTPRWLASRYTLLALVALQGSIDAVRDGSLKPSACFEVQPHAP